MYDEYNGKKGRIDEYGFLLDEYGHTKGRTNNGEVQDENGNVLGRFIED